MSVKGAIRVLGNKGTCGESEPARIVSAASFRMAVRPRAFAVAVSVLIRLRTTVLGVSRACLTAAGISNSKEDLASAPAASIA